jgi:hypothetical protein
MDDGLYSIRFTHFVFGVNHTTGDDFAILTDDNKEMYYVVKHRAHHDHPGKWEIVGKRPFSAILQQVELTPVVMDDQWRDFPEDKNQRMFLADQSRLDREFKAAQKHRP